MKWERVYIKRLLLNRILTPVSCVCCVCVDVSAFHLIHTESGMEGIPIVLKVLK